MQLFDTDARKNIKIGLILYKYYASVACVKCKPGFSVPYVKILCICTCIPVLTVNVAYQCKIQSSGGLHLDSSQTCRPYLSLLCHLIDAITGRCGL